MPPTLIQFHIDHSSLLPLLLYDLSIQKRNLAAPIGQTLLNCSIPLCIFSGFKAVKLEPGAGQLLTNQLEKKCFFVRSLIIVILNTQENTSLLFNDLFKDIINLINIKKSELFC